MLGQNGCFKLVIASRERNHYSPFRRHYIFLKANFSPQIHSSLISAENLEITGDPVIQFLFPPPPHFSRKWILNNVALFKGFCF